MAIDIRRRELLVTFGGTAAWAFTARAQQVAKLWRIGYLAESRRQVDEMFRQSLRKLVRRGFEPHNDLSVGAGRQL